MYLRHQEIQEMGASGESIRVLVWYYSMPASIEKESFRQAEVNGRYFTVK